jgi:SAM-dependent methyltransferase
MPYNDYDPIADLYDTYVPADFDFDFFLKETRACKGEVLELMAGSGRVSIPLLEAGVKLTCVDLSAGLNAILEDKLQQKGLRAEVIRMDVCELNLAKRFEMVIIPFHSFAHILTPADQREALRRIHQHLLPGGIFICTLGNPQVRSQAVDGQLRLLRKYPLPDGQGALLLWILEKMNPEDPAVVEALQIFEEYNPAGVMTSKRLMELHFRLSTREEFETMAIEAGFRITAFYGDYAYSAFDPTKSPFMVWKLEKVG